MSKTYTTLTKEECLELLRAKCMDAGRLPKKSDFSVEEIARIKSFFGPWPRALEAAGVKESHFEEKLQQKREKHIRAKIRIRDYKTAEKSQNNQGGNTR